MEKTNFAGYTVGRTGFGCIPIQRISYEESTALLRHAFENGVTVFDTANAYSTSEERIGIALKDVRREVVLCTKTFMSTPEKMMSNLENSLKMLQTDAIDVYQLHNPDYVPRPGGEDGVYDFLLNAKKQGKILHIGITNHSLPRAKEAVESGLYDTLQFPLSYLSTEEELGLAELCKRHNVGLLAMKGLGGGLLTNAKAAFAFLRQYDNVVPIWGIQKMSELLEFLQYEKEPPVLDDTLKAAIAADKSELSGTFCRSCGYCLPCPAGIPIPQAARIEFLLRRTVSAGFTTPEWQAQMRNIDNCIECGHCKANCPYGIDTPALLRQQQKAYFEFLG